MGQEDTQGTAGSEPTRRTAPRSDPSLWQLIVGDAEHRARLLLGLTLHALAQLLILDIVEAEPEDAMSIARATLIFGLALLILTTVYKNSLRIGNERVLVALSARCDRILTHLAALDLRAFESLDRAQLHRRLCFDRDLIGQAGSMVIELIASSLLASATIAYAVYISGYGAAALLLGMLLLIWQSRYLKAKVEVHAKVNERRRTQLLHRTWEIIRGFKELRLHGPRSEAVGAAYVAAANETHAHQREFLELFYRSDAWTRTGFYLLLGFITYLLPVLDLGAKQANAHLMLCLFFLGGTLSLIVISAARMGTCEQAWARLIALERQLAELAPSPSSSSAPAELRGFERITFEGLSYRYSPGGFQFGPVDLSVRAGELLFVTGANGSGKSTFLKLLLGLYPAEAGSILIDGRALGPGDRAAFASLFAVVLTDFAVFRRLYGNEHIPAERVRALLEEFGLAKVVDYADGEFSTVALSTGQRKRLAMVVALLADRQIYVFDEWAADQDPAFRAEYYRGLIPRLRAAGKTVIAVTHDEEWMHVADRCIHLERGRLAP